MGGQERSCSLARNREPNYGFVVIQIPFKLLWEQKCGHSGGDEGLWIAVSRVYVPLAASNIARPSDIQGPDMSNRGMNSLTLWGEKEAF